MDKWLNIIENFLSNSFSNIKFVEKALFGLQGSYVELLTVLALGLLAVFPVFIPGKNRQIWRHINQALGIGIFIFVVFTCLGVFGMIRNFHRGLSEIGRESIIALYYCSVPATILVTSMIFGPLFCGWVCPTGAIQELVGFITSKWNRKRKMEGYPFSKAVLAVSAIIAIIFIAWMVRLSVTRMFFVEDSNIYWSEVLIILLFILVFKMKDWDQKLRKLKILSFFIILIGAVLSIRITSPVHFGFAKVYDPASFLSTVMVALAALIIPNIWCRYLCPWRCVIGWAGKNSVRQIELSSPDCTQCGKCTEVCSVDAVKTGVINKDECHMCMKCVDICP